MSQKRFAVAVTLNGATLLLATFDTAREAAEELAVGRSSRWADAFVVAR
jgi:hypothetical protein